MEYSASKAKESRKGRKVDALALGGDEGRDKLRKAAGRRRWPAIRGCPNGATQPARAIPEGRRTRGTETSKYPEEEKTTVIPQVVVSERGGAQTAGVEAPAGL